MRLELQLRREIWNQYHHENDANCHSDMYFSPNSTPKQDNRIYNVFQTNDVSCKRWKRHEAWGEKGKGLTPPASKFVPRILLLVSSGGDGHS